VKALVYGEGGSNKLRRISTAVARPAAVYVIAGGEGLSIYCGGYVKLAVDRSDRVIRYSIRVFTSIVIIVFIVIFILKYIKENFFIFLY
jgi:hypothetical protein